MLKLKPSVNIAARDLSQWADYKYSGVIHILRGKQMFHRSKWYPRYAVVCKGKVGTWNFVYFLDHLANKAEAIYSMLEFESVKEYDDVNNSIIGFMIKFEKPLAPLVFSCDTRKSREEWIENIYCAILEAHKFSSDSAYASGGSIVSESNRLSKPYSTISDTHFTEEIDTPPSIVRQENARENVMEHSSTKTVNSEEESEESVVNKCDDPAKHTCNEIMVPENHTVKGTTREGSFPNKGRQYANGGKKDTDVTEVKKLDCYPIPEGLGRKSKHRRSKSDVTSAYFDSHDNKKEFDCGEVSSTCREKTTTGYAKNIQRKKETQKQATISSTLDEDAEPPYENIAFDRTGKTIHRLEYLKLGMEAQVDDDVTNTHTDVKQINKGIKRTRGQKDTSYDISERRGTNSSSEANLLQCLPKLSLEESSAVATVADSSSFLFVQGGQNQESLQSSFLIVQGGQSEESLHTTSGRFVSVRGSDRSVQIRHPVKERQKRSGASAEENNMSSSNSFVSVIGQNNTTRKQHSRSRTPDSNSIVSSNEDIVSSKISTSQSLASEEVKGVNSKKLQSERHKSKNGSQIYSSCEDIQLIASGTHDDGSSSATKSESSESAKERTVHSTSSHIDSITYSRTAEKGDTCSTLTQLGLVPGSEKKIDHSSSYVSDACFHDDEVIYENTKTIDITQSQSNCIDFGTNRSNSGSRESEIRLNYSKSVSSMGSVASLNSYENPDDSAQRESTKVHVFERREYFYAERKYIKRIMKNTSIGTFLVCPGESTREEIAVMTKCGLRLFRVHGQDGKCSLFHDNSKQVFPSIDCLLCYYSLENLPSADYEVKLEMAYNAEKDLTDLTDYNPNRTVKDAESQQSGFF